MGSTRAKRYTRSCQKFFVSYLIEFEQGRQSSLIIVSLFVNQHSEKLIHRPHKRTTPGAPPAGPINRARESRSKRAALSVRNNMISRPPTFHNSSVPYKSIRWTTVPIIRFHSSLELLYTMADLKRVYAKEKNFSIVIKRDGERGRERGRKGGEACFLSDPRSRSSTHR